LPLDEDRIIITRTAASIDAIPASQAIFIEALRTIGGKSEPYFLIHQGDNLPVKGSVQFKAGESLKAGSSSSLNFKIWEGEIKDPIEDNRLIGTIKISGTDFDDGVIPAGADLDCSYEILDSGAVIIEISVPKISGTFHSGKNFYSRQEGQMDFSSAAQLVKDEGERTLERIENIDSIVNDPKLDQARRKLELAASLDPDETESEKSQEAMDKVLEARKLIAKVRKENLKQIRQMDLDIVVDFFNARIRDFARPSESVSFDNLAKTAQRSINQIGLDFERNLTELRGKNFDILWRQDWFVVEKFKWMISVPHLFPDKQRYAELVKTGNSLMQSDDIEKLRMVVAQLYSMQIRSADSEMIDVTNIIWG
jgi:molecular chaperone DnaK